MAQQLRTWGRGLIGAVLNSLGSAVALTVVDPSDFNPLDGSGWRKLLSVLLVSALMGAGLYLKTHPLPADE